MCQKCFGLKTVQMIRTNISHSELFCCLLPPFFPATIFTQEAMFFFVSACGQTCTSSVNQHIKYHPMLRCSTICCKIYIPLIRGQSEAKTGVTP